MKIKKYSPLFILLFIISIAAFFRLYRIGEYITFLGDEGRDVLVVKRMIVDHKFTLLGPITSVGSMYMGPVYYYLMAPFLWLWGFDPVGPAIMVVIFSLLTIYLIYRISVEFLNSRTAAVTASFLYAISPLPIIYGRSSWNPNIVPFFSTLIIYSMLKVVIRKKNKWLLVSGFSLGILLQLHYVTFMFFPILAAIFIIMRPRIPIKYYLLGLSLLVLSYSPFILFELRHGFVNTNSVWRFFWQQRSESPINFMSIWQTVSDIAVRLFWRLPVVYSAEYAKLLILILMAFFYFIFKKKTKTDTKRALLLILIWFGVGIFSYGLYRGVIYDYYLGSFFAVPYLILGYFISRLWDFSLKGRILAFLLLALLVIFNLAKSPLIITPNNLLANTKTIAQFVFDKSEGQPYNFALIAGKNSDHAYRYFLELWGNPPVTIENPVNDSERKTVTKQLLVICEEKICRPLGHPLWEIAGFGPAEIEGEWTVSTAKVFKLMPVEVYQK